MSELTPQVAALLAAEIYAVKDQMTDELVFRLYGMNKDGVKNPTNKKGLFDAVGAGGSGAKLPNMIQLKNKSGSRSISWETTRGLFIEGEGQYEGHLFLVFRGTAPPRDWVTDMRQGFQKGVTGSCVHSGFDSSFRDMIPSIEVFLHQLPHNGGRPYKIHCIGHSLGGALAAIAADWLKKEKNIPNVRLYTFGAPRIGFMRSAKAMTSRIGAENIYRVYNQFDPVPCTPPFPYVHAPYGSGTGDKKYVLSFFRGKKSHPHSMDNYRDAIGTKSWADLAEKESISIGKNFFGNRKGVTYKKGARDRLTYTLSQVLRVIAVPVNLAVLGSLTAHDKLAWYTIQLAKICHRKVPVKPEAYHELQALKKEVQEKFGVHLAENASPEECFEILSMASKAANQELGEEALTAMSQAQYAV